MPCREREESAARCGPKGTPLIERLASRPTAKKKFVYDKNQPLLSPPLEGFRWILPPRRSARAAHESLQRSEGTGGDLSVLSTWREELSANSCSHNVIFVFRKLELSLENREKKEVKAVRSFTSQHPPIPPAMATSAAIPGCHSNQCSLNLLSRSAF